jgi:hypothetical protein
MAKADGDSRLVEILKTLQRNQTGIEEMKNMLRDIVDRHLLNIFKMTSGRSPYQSEISIYGTSSQRI